MAEGRRKMVKPVYKRELSHSYLVIEGIPKEKTDSYQYRMILNNKISQKLKILSYILLQILFALL